MQSPKQTCAHGHPHTRAHNTHTDAYVRLRRIWTHLHMTLTHMRMDTHADTHMRKHMHTHVLMAGASEKLA